MNDRVYSEQNELDFLAGTSTLSPKGRVTAGGPEGGGSGQNSREGEGFMQGTAQSSPGGKSRREHRGGRPDSSAQILQRSVQTPQVAKTVGLQVARKEREEEKVEGPRPQQPAKLPASSPANNCCSSTSAGPSFHSGQQGQDCH